MRLRHLGALCALALAAPGAAFSGGDGAMDFGPVGPRIIHVPSKTVTAPPPAPEARKRPIAPPGQRDRSRLEAGIDASKDRDWRQLPPEPAAGVAPAGVAPAKAPPGATVKAASAPPARQTQESRAAAADPADRAAVASQAPIATAPPPEPPPAPRSAPSAPAFPEDASRSSQHARDDGDVSLEAAPPPARLAQQTPSSAAVSGEPGAPAAPPPNAPAPAEAATTADVPPPPLPPLLPPAVAAQPAAFGASVARRPVGGFGEVVVAASTAETEAFRTRCTAKGGALVGSGAGLCVLN